jgi:predicted MFS family arabinose efflux permease
LAGAFTLFSSRWIGGLADRYGKPKIFRIFGLISIVPILIITNLHATPLPIILLCTTFFMVVVTGRVIPAMALITSSVHPWQRGSFMSLNSSVQMAGSALAALFCGDDFTGIASGENFKLSLGGAVGNFCDAGMLVAGGAH